MASASRSFEVKFLGNTKGLTQSFKDIQRQAGVMGKSVTVTSGLMRTALASVSVAGITKSVQSAVMAASSLSESIAKTNQVFAQNADSVNAWSKTTSKSFGVSQQAALEAASTYGNLFRAFGVSADQAASMSKGLVELAADMASFNNVPIADALNALRSGLSGEAEPLKRFGVALTDARLKEEALRMGLIKTTTGVLPAGIRLQAAYALVMKDTALAQGDVSRTSGGLANQLKFLQAGLQDAQAGFGELLLPAVTNLVNAMNDSLLPALERIQEAFALKGADAGLSQLVTEITKFLSGLEGAAKMAYNFITIVIGMKIVAPIIYGIRTAWLAAATGAEVAATATQIAATTMKTALISTGIGAIVVAVGTLAAYLIQMGISARAAAADVNTYTTQQTFANASIDYGAQSSINMANGFMYASTAIASTVPYLDAAALAASRAADQIENAAIRGYKASKLLGGGGTTTGTPVPTIKAPKLGGAGGASKSAKSAAKATQTVNDAISRLTNSLQKLQDNLESAKNAYKGFADGIASAIKDTLSFSAAAEMGGSFIKALEKQATKASGFADKVKTLIAMGLSETGVSQVLAAGADAGTRIADELIKGGAGAVGRVNDLVSAVESVADQLGSQAADRFYSAGVSQAQSMLDGFLATIRNAGLNFAGGSIKLPKGLADALKSGKLTKKQQKKLAGILGAADAIPALAAGGIVTSPTLALIGEAGPEAVVPLSKMQGSTTNLNITVNAGMGVDGVQVGRQIIEAIKTYERSSGKVFASA